MKKIATTLICLFAFFNSMMAQTDSKEESKEEKVRKVDWKRDIKLVKSLQSKSNKDEKKPAVFSLTIPDEKDASYLINGALGLNWIGLFADPTLTESELHTFVEYNRNTLIDKEQNQFQTGLSFQSVINLNYIGLTPTINANAKYVNDFIKEVESFQSSFIVSPKITGVKNTPGKFWVPDNIVAFGSNKPIQFEYIPAIGIETESRADSDNETLNGDKVRLLYKFEANFYLFKKTDDKGRLESYRLILSVDYQFRNEFYDDTEDNLENGNFLQCGANYSLLKNKNIEVKVGLDYVNGANPSEAFEEQDYYSLNLKIKI